jgi:hypothetical protein
LAWKTECSDVVEVLRMGQLSVVLHLSFFEGLGSRRANELFL